MTHDIDEILLPIVKQSLTGSYTSTVNRILFMWEILSLSYLLALEEIARRWAKIPIKKFDKKLSKAQIKSFFSHKPKWCLEMDSCHSN
jgi:hypothetical protein